MHSLKKSFSVSLGIIGTCGFSLRNLSCTYSYVSLNSKVVSPKKCTIELSCNASLTNLLTTVESFPPENDTVGIYLFSAYSPVEYFS